MEASGVSLVLAALAVYRLSKAVTEEDGPLYCLRTLRRLAYRVFGDGWIFDGLTCPKCASVWFGLAAAWLLNWPWWWGLALSAVTVLAQEMSNGRNA